MTPQQIDAMKLALAALKQITHAFLDTNGSHGQSEEDAIDAAYESITALEEALAETQYWDEKYKLLVQEVQEHPPQRTEQEPLQQEAAALFREALAFGLAYGPAIPAHQWAEMREEKVAQLVLRLAASQPPQCTEQEPVAHWSDCAVHSEPAYPKGECDCGGIVAVADYTALSDKYVALKAQRTWVALTEQEHTDIAVECGCMSADWVFYGAAVERKVKERNQ